MCALLVNEPWKLRPWEIAQLTPWQVRNLYLCDRDEEGKVLTSDIAEIEQNPYEYFRKYWQTLGLRDDQVERLWRASHG